MSFSFLSSSRTVLLVSDDFLSVYTVGKKGASLVGVIPWGEQDFVKKVSDLVVGECGGKSVLILNDMVEVHYRKEKLPRVSPMDKRNVLQRKLMVAFPNYPVRAAFELKEKMSKAEQRASSGIFIFAAIPASDAFNKVMEATRVSLANVSGFCLLPVESSDMIEKLSVKLSPKGGVKPKWTILVGQHSGGGLRQVIIKDGDLSLTRMTTVSENADVETWVDEVSQEFKATMSYLSRFGFDSSDGLNVILITDQERGDAVRQKFETPCNFYALSIDDAARLLGVPVGVKAEDLYKAEILHVAWAGQKAKLLLPMKAKAIDKVSKPRQAVMVLSLLTLVGGAYQGYQCATTYGNFQQVQVEVEDSKARQARLQAEYDSELKRKAELGFDIQLIQSSLSVYHDLDRRQVDVLGIIQSVAKAVGREMRIDTLDVMQGGVKKDPAGFFSGSEGADQNKGDVLFIAKMQMTFPSTTDAQKGNKEVKDFQGRLQALLPGHVVTVTKFLEDYEYSEEIVIESGDTGKTAAASQDFVSEITIEGPVI